MINGLILVLLPSGGVQRKWSDQHLPAVESPPIVTPLMPSCAKVQYPPQLEFHLVERTQDLIFIFRWPYREPLIRTREGGRP
jgi:hypothetical protein